MGREGGELAQHEWVDGMHRRTGKGVLDITALFASIIFSWVKLDPGLRDRKSRFGTAFICIKHVVNFCFNSYQKDSPNSIYPVPLGYR